MTCFCCLEGFKPFFLLSVLKLHNDVSVGLFSPVVQLWWALGGLFHIWKLTFFNSVNLYWILSLTALPLLCYPSSLSQIPIIWTSWATLLIFSPFLPYLPTSLFFYSTFGEVSSTFQFCCIFHFCHHIFNFQPLLLFVLWILLSYVAFCSYFWVAIFLSL